ncbi:MAG TPA: hypothetical protein VF139_07955 [Candidatus Polarisedimenticolaceae bacterium]
MRGLVSFHPADVAFFDDVIAPLVAGRKINPEPYLQEAIRLRKTWWRARRWPRALTELVEAATPPSADPTARLWDRIRTNLEKIDFRAPELARKAMQRLEADLHVDGRPFFVAEGSAERVAAAVEAFRTADGEPAADRLARDQASRLDPSFVDQVEPRDGEDLSADLQHRNDLLASLKRLFDLGRAAREGGSWPAEEGQPSRPAVQALAQELAWRAVWLHSRVQPFWVGRDVDGLETICRASGVPAPDCLVPAWRLFAESCDAFPEVKEGLHLEIQGPRDVGAFVAPGEVGALVEFLTQHGTRILAAAARAGEGPAATVLLRKIKECAVYAERRGLGYLEAAGIVPPDLEG